MTVTSCVNVFSPNVIADNGWTTSDSSIKGFVHIGKGYTDGMDAVVGKSFPVGEIWLDNPVHNKTTCIQLNTILWNIITTTPHLLYFFLS